MLLLLLLLLLLQRLDCPQGDSCPHSHNVSSSS
jgi:hypothetical protein